MADAGATSRDACWRAGGAAKLERAAGRLAQRKHSRDLCRKSPLATIAPGPGFAEVELDLADLEVKLGKGLRGLDQLDDLQKVVVREELFSHSPSPRESIVAMRGVAARTRQIDKKGANRLSEDRMVPAERHY
jgi:hypothetical protein